MVVHATYPLGETRVERQAHALLERGYAVDVVCLRANGEQPFEIVDGVHVYRLPVRRHKGSGLVVQMLEYLAFFTLALIRLVPLHLKRGYGVVQVHNLPDFLVFAALGPKLTGARLILDIHDLMPEFFAGSYGRSMDSLPVRLLALQEQLSRRFADHVITVSQHWKETLIRRGVPPVKVTVVMNVADDRIFTAGSPNGGSSSHDHRFRLIYHGNLTERYGVDLILHAINQLRGQIPGLHLTIHGKGDYLPSLIALADELGVNDHVHFSTDYLPTPDLPRLIGQADIGIVPYRSDIFTDGILPTKLMEYVALGVPVIAARTPAITSYFDETMVRFFTPGSVDELAACIQALYASPAQRAKLALNAERFKRQYNWPVVAQEYVSLVDRLNTRQGEAS
jgi:glycosyltransferase involved in cell wall biosynthesis